MLRLLIFTVCMLCAPMLQAQDLRQMADTSGLPVFFPPEEGVRGGFDPVTDKDVFNPYLFYSNSKNLGEGFKRIKERRKYYRAVNDSVGTFCRWFKAACIVTQRNSLGAADYFNFWLLNKQSTAFMKQGNAYLFIFNRNVSEQLLKYGKIDRIFVTASFKDSGRQEVYIYQKKNKELDKALVLFEQTLVQYYIDIYQQQHPGLDMAKTFRGINRAMRLPFAPQPIRKVLKNRFSKKQRFHFQSFDDRVKLGFGLIDYLYK